MSRQIQGPGGQLITEMVVAVSVSYVHRVVQVGVAPATEDGGELVPVVGATVYTTIRGDQYNELMAESPEWAPGKPAGSFREQDLFHILDQMEAA